MIAPTPSAPNVNAHHGLANAARHVSANIARRADLPGASVRQTERANTPGGNALDRLHANAQRIDAKRSAQVEAKADPIPQPIEPAPTIAVTGDPIEPAGVERAEPWSTGRFVITA